MATFRVWAPRATRVELVIGPRRIPMTGEAAGGWTVDVPEAGPGTDYAFALEGDAPLPDPRSPWQPSGVHGPSRVIDHGAFTWSDARWQPPPPAAAVIYELPWG